MENIISSRPLSEKVGGNFWNYYYSPGKYSMTAFENMFDYELKQAVNIGLKYARLGVAYDESSLKNNGEIDFDRLDYAVSQFQAAGLKVIMPIWAVNDFVSHPDYQIQLIHYQTLIQQLTEHFSGKSIIYEGIDEADGADHYFFDQATSKNQMNDWFQLEKLYADQVAKDGSATFINGDLKFIDNESNGKFNYLDKIGLSSLSKYFSWHPYVRAVNGMAQYPEKLLGDLENNNFLTHYKNQTLVTSEFGYCVDQRFAFNGLVDNQTKFKWDLRELFVLDSLGVSIMCPFAHYVMDWGWCYEYGPETDALRPVGNAFKHILSVLQGYQYSGSALKEESQTDYAFWYQNGKDKKLVYWTIAGKKMIQLINGESVYADDFPQVMDTNYM